MTTTLFYPKFDCNVGCEYCFTDKEKANCGLSIPQYNKEKMIETAKKMAKNCNCSSPTIIMHGGELLSLPIEDFAWFVDELHKIYKTISMQTSLMGLTEDHIRIIKGHDIHLGISIDGPPELNILRGPRNKDLNDKYQLDLVENIKLLKREKIHFGTISVLTKANASEDKLDILEDWILKNEISGRFNPMFLPNWAKDTPLAKYELTSEEVKNVWIRLIKLNKKEPHLDLAPMKEFAGNLLGDRLSPCVVSRCDNIKTRCDMITPDGGISHCDRCLQDGIYYTDKATYTNYRSEILKQTECKDCRYFCICGGGCPGEAVDGDFRRKTKFCSAYYAVYEYLEDGLRSIPNVTLAVDVENYFENYFLKGRDLGWKNKRQNHR